MKKFNKILMLDDDPLVNVINEQLFRRHNAASEYLVFRTSEEAISYLNNTDILPDVILVDINIPLINGFQFLDYCFNILETNSECSVYILSSSTSQEDMSRSEKYPFVKGYLKKPLSRDAIQRLLE